MVISILNSGYLTKLGMIGRPGMVSFFARMALTVLVVSTLCLASASAKQKTKRRAYSPPQAAMVIDGHTGKVLYSSNPDARRFPASITKVMTLYLLFEQIRDGHMTNETQLKVSSGAASRPPSKLGLKAGSTISVRNAIHVLVTKSANDVAAVVAENIAGSEAAFARMMTQKARDMGMSKTTFRNASGLPDPEQVTTARDLITLGRRMLTDFPKKTKAFNTRYFQYGKRKFRNHNRLLFSYKGMEGLKTGFTRASGFNLLTSGRREGKYLIAVVLGGHSGKARNNRMRKLLDASWKKAVTLEAYKEQQPMIIAGVVAPENLPERNPAFHDVDLDEPVETEAAEAEAAEVEEAETEAVESEVAVHLASAGQASSVQPVVVIADAVSESAPEPQIETKKAVSRPKPVETASINAPGPYHIQVGSFLSPNLAQNHLVKVSEQATSMLHGHSGYTAQGEVRGKSYFRARYAEFSQSDAASTCAKLKKLKIDCLVLRVE
jgi:D-alanyl-D-alanine carboxypeptidase